MPAISRNCYKSQCECTSCILEPLIDNVDRFCHVKASSAHARPIVVLKFRFPTNVFFPLDHGSLLGSIAHLRSCGFLFGHRSFLLLVSWFLEMYRRAGCKTCLGRIIKRTSSNALPSLMRTLPTS